MVLGISLQTFTLIHVLISLAGITAGLVVVYGFLTNKRLDGWTAVFLITTALTSVTGFLFPFRGVTPAFRLSLISLAVLAVLDRDMLSTAPHLAQNLCHYTVRGAVL